MSAISGSSRELSVYKKDGDKDKKDPILKEITHKDKNNVNKYINLFESHYPIMQIGQSIGLSNPTQVAKLMPPKMSKKFFNKCWQTGIMMGLDLGSMDMDKCFSGASIALHGMASAAVGNSLEQTRILFIKNKAKTDTRLQTYKNDVQQALGGFFARHTDWFATQFQAAGVTFYDQFYRKSALISQSKELAEIRYLSHPENFIKRKRIDLYFFDGYLDSPEDHQTVARYWDFLLGREDGATIHQMVESHLKAIVSDCFDKFYAVYREIKTDARKHEDKKNQMEVFDWPKKLPESLLYSAKSLIDFRDLALPNISIVESYFILKAKMALHMIGNREIRKKLAPKFEKLKADILSERGNAMATLIYYYKTVIKISEALINNTECDEPNFSQMKEAWLSQPPSERKIVTMLDGTPKEGLAPLYELLQRTEERAESSDEVFLSNNLTQEQKNFRSILEVCKETPLERLFFDSYTVIWGNDTLNPRERNTILQDIDMQCDLDAMVDPIAYFEDLISLRDEERLILASTMTSSFIEGSSSEASFIRDKLQKQQAKEEARRKSWKKTEKKINKSLKDIWGRF